MREAAVPADDLPPLTRSVAACLAAILELGATEVPTPPADHPEPWTVWRNWLGQRGLGLVRVLEPARFSWPGPWLALLRSATDGGLVAAVAFGSPPGLVWSPLGGPEPFEAVEQGYLVAPADVALWAPAASPTVGTGGRVEALLVAHEAEGPLVTVPEAVAHAGRGLAGDRYHDGRGTFSNVHARGVDLTLVAAESLETLGLPGGALAPEAARRNVVTRGIDLDALVGRPFRIGEVECLGQRACEPCAHLQRLAGPGTLRALVHRGGLRADVCSDGVIRVGDPVVAL